MPLKLAETGKFSVEDYTFSSFQEVESKEGIETYQIEELTEHRAIQEKKSEPIIKLENKVAKEEGFKISPITKKFRGISKLEEEEYQTFVKREVENRVEKLKQSAYEEGFERGQKDGRKDILEEMKAEATAQLIELGKLFDDLSKTKENIIENQQREIYQLINTLCKWVTLKELKGDGEYISRLLKKMIMELQSKENLLIEVNKEYFKKMPAILEEIEKEIGKLTNVRLEVLSNESVQGIIVESDNGILDGTLEAQFDNLDKLFESLDLFEDTKISGPSATDDQGNDEL